MELYDAPKPINPDDKISSQEYELNLGEDIYLLKMEIISKQKIGFNIRQINNISYYYFYEEYDYEALINELTLPPKHYDTIDKVFKFYDTSINKKKVVLTYDKDKKEMALVLKITIMFDEIESKLYLKENQLTNEEMIKILFNEIRDLKTKKLLQLNRVNVENKNQENNQENIKKDEIINKLVAKNEELELKINQLITENKTIKENLEQCLKYIQEKKNKKKQKEELNQKIKEENDNFIKQNINVEFKEKPQNLKLRETLTSNASSCDQQSKFAVYIGIQDHIEYLVYNNKNNNNLDIMRIKDKTIINSLKGHNANTIVIRYYLKNNKEEYILSSDKNKLVIIWDIQNFYSKKYTIQAQYSGDIYDALLLFNVFNKDYILLSNSTSNEYSKLYEFKENTPFVRNIHGTNDHITYFMIPWLYQNKYYLIECSYNKIFINNMFEDENYANLSLDPEGSHFCGYLYNDNYLCVSEYNQNFVRIWDLTKKVIYKQINYEGTYNTCSYEIIPWNINYTIFGCDRSFVIMNITDGKMIKKIDVNDSHEIRSMKKIKIGQIGECLICVGGGSDNSIQLYSI